MTTWPIAQDAARAERFGFVAASTQGTTVAAGNATKGSYTQLIAATGFEYDAVLLIVGAQSGTNDSVVVDIAIGAAASEQIVLADTYWGQSARDESAYYYVLPFSVPTGSRIAARAAAEANSSVNIDVSGIGLQGGFNREQPFSKVDTIGATTGAGTDLTSPGSINTKGAWTQMVASAANDYEMLCVQLSNSSDGAFTDAAGLLDIGVGAASSEQVVLPDLRFGSDGTTDFQQPQPAIYACNIPGGSRIAARTAVSAIEQKDLMLYGFVR